MKQITRKRISILVVTILSITLLGLIYNINSNKGSISDSNPDVKDTNEEKDPLKISEADLLLAKEKGIILDFYEDQSKIPVDSNGYLLFSIQGESYSMKFEDFIASLSDTDFDYSKHLISTVEKEEIVEELVKADNEDSETNKDESLSSDDKNNDKGDDSKVSNPNSNIPNQPNQSKPDLKPGSNPDSNQDPSQGSRPNPTPNPTPSPKPEENPNPGKGESVKPPIVEKKWVVVREEIEETSFKVVTIDDPNMIEGNQKITKQGSTGLSRTIHRCLSTDGIIDNSNCKVETIVEETPIDRVISNGTQKIVYKSIVSDDAYNKEVLRLVNEYRVANGVEPMQWFSEGEAAGAKRAQQLMEEIQTSGTISHNNAVWSENISMTGGGASPLVTFNQYKASPPHNASMLSKSFTKMSSHTITRTSQLGTHYSVNAMQFD